jgi:hypothetical protein
MPIKDKAAYGPGWDAWSADLRKNRASNRCECRGECGSPRHRTGWCKAINSRQSPYTGSVVVLTTAHIHDAPKDTRDPEAVVVMCQLCHLAYDAEDRAAARRAAAELDDRVDAVRADLS